MYIKEFVLENTDGERITVKAQSFFVTKQQHSVVGGTADFLSFEGDLNPWSLGKMVTTRMHQLIHVGPKNEWVYVVDRPYFEVNPLGYSLLETTLVTATTEDVYSGLREVSVRLLPGQRIAMRDIPMAALRERGYEVWSNMYTDAQRAAGLKPAPWLWADKRGVSFNDAMRKIVATTEPSARSHYEHHPGPGGGYWTYQGERLYTSEREAFMALPGFGQPR